MPLYQCRALDPLGKEQTFVREAADEVSLLAALKGEQYVLLRATPITEKKVNTFFSVSSRVKPNEVIMFLRQFAVMIRATAPISVALDILRKQKFSAPFRRVLNEVYHDVQSGMLLSAAFAKHPKIFPRFFVSMVEIGEEVGSLDSVLSSMADYYENDRKIKRKAKSAMTYPTFLLAMIVVVVAFIMLYIVPQFEGTIRELGGDIPKITQVILGISAFLRTNFIWVLAGAVLTALILILLIRKTRGGRLAYDWFRVHCPVIGAIERSVITSRFCRAFIILLSSGMTMVDCLHSLERMLSNRIYREKFGYTVSEVKRGKRLSRALEATGLFPPMLTEMLKVGEESGNIEEVLESTSGYFDETVETTIARATTILEPMMILLLGGVVAIVLLSVLLPMFSLMNSI